MRDYTQAIRMVEGNGIDLRNQDFHELRSDAVDVLVEQARIWKYRKPQNANGSTARYFFQLLKRRKAQTA